MSLIILQEADELIYRCGFAAETTRYKAINRHTGEERTLREGVDLKKLHFTLAEIYNKTGAEYDVIKYKEAEPVSHAIRLMKNKIEWLKTLGDVRLFISPADKSNFRYAVAKTAGPNGFGYKAGRKEKPIHYESLREYVLKYHKAEEAFGYEADDFCSMNQTDNTVISSIDKDLDMVEGKHLNWVTGKRYIVPQGLGTMIYDKGKCRGLGLIQFYAQLLIGDNTDNIPGIKGIGHKKAYDLLKEAKTEEDAFNVVKSLYLKNKCLERLPEIADLLWMVRCDKLTGSQYLKERGFL
jgi:hypothetical protein